MSFFRVNHKHCIFAVAALWLLFTSSLTYAGEFQFIRQFDQQNLRISQIIPKPHSPNSYFILTQAGDVHLFENETLQKEHFFSVSSVTDNVTQHLHAISFHPNFAFTDQLGFQTFYTAHHESFNPDATTARLPNNNDAAKSDIVITEWSTNLKGNHVDTSTRREVLRISDTSDDMRVIDLSFDPYAKPWLAEFGQLYIALSASNQPAHAIETGVIINIDPKPFGLRSYTTPKRDAGTKAQGIQDEIVLHNAGKISQLLWPKQTSHSWLVVHQQENQVNLYTANIGNDLSKQKPVYEVLLLPEQKVSNFIWYQGREIKQFLYHIMYLDKSENTWNLKALTLEDKPATVQNLLAISDNFNLDAALITDHQHELLVFTPDNQQVSRIHFQESELPEPKVSHTRTIRQEEQESTNTSLLYIIIFMLITVVVLLLSLKTKKAKKQRPEADFSTFNINEDDDGFELYIKHQKEIAKTLPIADITGIKIKLNGNMIYELTKVSDVGFSNQAENLILDTFALEHRHKMVDNKTRTIEVLLASEAELEESVLIYYRTGNQRYTRLHYHDCLTKIIDALWLYSSIVKPEQTEERVTKTDIQLNSKTNDQVIIKESVIYKKVEPTKSVEPTEPKAPEQASNFSSNANTSENFHPTISQELDKLVTLKQQGHISEAEFTKAKQKLFASIVN